MRDRKLGVNQPWRSTRRQPGQRCEVTGASVGNQRLGLAAGTVEIDPKRVHTRFLS